MSEHARFHFDTLNALKAKLDELGLSLPFDDNFDRLYEPLTVGNQKLPNRFVVQPMEGFDADLTGTPQELSFRRYLRYAAGGSALIWFEATAMTPNSRSNPHQFHLNPENVAVFKKLVDETRRVGREKNGFEPTMILQLTHSGRYSKPTGKPAPIIAHHSPILDPKHNLPADYPLITDDELDELQENYLFGAQLAFEAGFDGVDIKACHRYLVSELLASFTRENSRYGGSFENRTRFLREVAEKIHSKFPEKLISTRMNVFDAISHPYGWGVSEEDYHIPNLEEPKKFIGQLRDAGMKIINISIGNPYFNPHFGRPYDHPIRGVKAPEEHPLRGLARFVDITRDIQQTYPDLPIIGSGYTWLRHFMPYAAAGTLKTGGATLIGQGRGMFAYPNSVNELREKGTLDPHKVCVTCSACTQIMRDGAYTGCVVRDSKIYAPIYRKYTQMAKDTLKIEAEHCRDCFAPTCQEKCPAGINVPKFIKAYADGDIKTAYETLTEKNLLPEICAYVCPAEEQCQAGCVEKLFTGKSIR
ncbi:hypothetical protein KAH55_06430, partial [bacterium]|nr:hypothetical protein [bacterium]